MPSVVLLGTLDTKGPEYEFLRSQLEQHGVDVVVVDAGVFGANGCEPDITRSEVASAVGADVEALAKARDRGDAVSQMADGAAAILRRLHEDGRLDAALAVGGTGGSSLASHAFQALPVGVPRLLVSTVASGDTRPYVGAHDIAMMYSVLDIAGINSVSSVILSNAAAAVAGMAKSEPPVVRDAGALIGATMFGVTTQGVTAARATLEGLDYEVLVFHATGTGGLSMENLVRNGHLSGVLDMTTTELADDLVGGVFSAGPHRLEIAGELGVPQVVSVGALDMVNFGPRASVPPQFESRLLYQHNPTVTLMRTSPDECRELGIRLATKLNMARGPVALYLPLLGVSALSTAGQPFHDPVADEALWDGIRQTLSQRVELHELDLAINDKEFATEMALKLNELCSGQVSK